MIGDRKGRQGGGPGEGRRIKENIELIKNFYISQSTCANTRVRDINAPC